MAAINQYTISTTTSQRTKTSHVLVSLVLLVAIWTLTTTFERQQSLLAFQPVASDASPGNIPDASIITKNAAVIIEDRPLETLVPLLLHFASVLGPQWPIIFYTSQDVYPNSAPLRRAIDDQKITVRFLPSTTKFSTRDSVSEFLTEPWLWEELAPAEHVLLFQADSIICSNSPLRVDDFLEYDFVGAPIDPGLGHGEGYNGGLSLRNRTMVLDIINESSWSEEKRVAEDPQEPSVEFEDQWFVKKMKLRGARLPTIEVAQTFAVETLWHERPLGYHQVTRWQSHNTDEVDAWCPEHRMAMPKMRPTREWIYSQRDFGPGALAIAFDPFFGEFISSDITCLPPSATLWWNQVTQTPLQTVTSLGPFACPGLYTTASTSILKPGSTFVACCPTSYEFQQLTTRLGQCNSPLSAGQIFTYFTFDDDSREYVSASTTIPLSSSVLAVHVNGYVFAAATESSTVATASATVSSSPVTTQSRTAIPSSTADLALETGIPSANTSLLPTSDSIKSGFSAGAKAGIGVGVSLAIVGLASLIGAIYLLRSRKRRSMVPDRRVLEEAPPYSSRKPSSTFSWQDPLVGMKDNNNELGFVHELSTTPRVGF